MSPAERTKGDRSPVPAAVESVEQWRPIPGYGYEVSNWGRVRRAAAGQGCMAGRVLAGGRAVGEWPRVRLSRDNRSDQHYVAHLVARVWLEVELAPGRQIVSPRDGDHANTRPENLLIRPWGAGRKPWEPKLRESRRAARRARAPRPRLPNPAPRPVAEREPPPPAITRRFDPRDAEPDYGAPFRRGYAAWMDEKRWRRERFG